MPESNFEIAFSDLAHASLIEKAPGLAEHLVGFQILDKNEEDTQAVAVFGFKIGNQWLYAPTFFLNGALKGLNLLYVKGQDIFVPLQDNWVNYLISKQPRNIGQSEQVPEADLNISAPDFRVFSESPGTSSSKWASVIQPRAIKEWARPFLPAYRDLIAGFRKKASELENSLDLRNVLKKNPALTPTLLTSMRKNIKLAEAVLTFYDLKDLLPEPKLVKQALLNMGPNSSKQFKVNGSKSFNPNSSSTLNLRKQEGPGMSGKVEDKEAAAGCLNPGMKMKSKGKGLGLGTGAGKGPLGVPYKKKVEEEEEEKTAEHVGNYHSYQTRFLGEYNSTEAILNSLTWKGKEKKAAADGEIIEKGPESPAVEVYTQEDVPQVLSNSNMAAALTDAEKEQLQRGEMVIRDHRENTSTVYEAEFDRHLTNPTESGVYDVLTNTGKFERCLVLCSPKTIGQGRTSSVCTLIALDGKIWGNFRTIDILVHHAEQAVLSFNDRFNDVMNKAKELDSMRSGYLYVLIGPDGQGTIPFKFLVKSTRNDGTTVFAVYPKTRVCRSKNSVKSTTDYRTGYRTEDGIYLEDFDSGPMPGEPYDSNKPYSAYELCESRQLIQSDRGNHDKLKSVAGVSYVPTHWKALEIGADSEDNRTAKREEMAKTFEPGSLMDAETFVLKTGAVDLTIQKDGPEIVVRHEGGQSRLNKTAALKHLVYDWQMKAEDATELVKRASDQRMVQCFVKLAQGLEMAPGGPAFPAYDSSYSTQLGVPIQESQTDFVGVEGMQPDPSNSFEYNLMDDPEVQQALQAGAKGQKEVFDIAMVNGLVKAVDVNAMVDSFLPDMIKGMDRVGRVLFLYFWHNEKFRDRYGRQDLIELEDSLKNVFKSTGDLVLFLKQKTIEAEPMTDAIDIDLES